jgi:hypothetical protein
MRTFDKIKLWLKVNIYNPMRPHIVYSDHWGGYYIRRLGWWDCEFLDEKSRHFFWWMSESDVKKYCTFLTLTIAKKRLLEYNAWSASEGFTRVIDED